MATLGAAKISAVHKDISSGAVEGIDHKLGSEQTELQNSGEYSSVIFVSLGDGLSGPASM